MALVCHVISEDHVIKGSYDFLGDSSSRQVTIQPSLVAIVTLTVEICFEFVM